MLFLVGEPFLLRLVLSVSDDDVHAAWGAIGVALEVLVELVDDLVEQCPLGLVLCLDWHLAGLVGRVIPTPFGVHPLVELPYVTFLSYARKSLDQFAQV